MADSTNIQYSYQWFIEQFQDAKDRAVDFCEPLGHEKFVQRPHEDTWSVGECYSHLNTFGQQYLKQVRKGLEEAPRDQQPKPEDQAYPPRILWKLAIAFFAPPYKIKVKTVKPFHPETKAHLKKEQVLNDYIQMQQEFIDLLNDARVASIDLGSTKVSNPLISLAKMRLSECFAVVEVHQRRHMWQAEQVLNMLQHQP